VGDTSYYVPSPRRGGHVPRPPVSCTHAWCNISLSSWVIQAASFLRDRAYKDRQTDRQTNAGEKPTPATCVGVGN